MSFKDLLSSSLQQLTEEATFEVHDLKSNLYKCSEPLIKQHTGGTYCRHRLLLISTKDSGFLCGLESYEYVLSGKDSDERLIIYVSKVDTTATFKKYQGLTTRLVQAYIASLPRLTSVFVFARAQPQYLFAKSAENKSKSILDDRGLVSWWLNTLNKTPIKCEGWWSVPGTDDSGSALIEIGARKRGWKASDSIKWNYGSSFPENAEADLVIPRFDDDAKSRLLKNLQESNENDKLSVLDFWNILSIGEECGSGKVTGFFELKIVDDKNEKLNMSKEKSDLKNSDFTLFWNKFMSLDFHDDKSNLESRAKALSDIRNIFPAVKPTQINVFAKQPILDKDGANSGDKIDKLKTSENVTVLEKRPAINTLSSSFIKRKKV